MSLKDSGPVRAAASIEHLSGLRLRCCATSLVPAAPPCWGEFHRGPVPRPHLGVADHQPATASLLGRLVTVGRKLVLLGPETLDLVPEPCPHCGSSPPVARTRPRGPEHAGLQKETWASTAGLQSDPDGHVVSVD